MSDTLNNPEDHQQILRYLRKQMDSDELAEFEVRLMSDTNLFRETQREEALIAALKECQDALACVEASPRVLGLRDWIFQPMTAAAAVLIVIVSVPMIGLQQTAMREPPIQSLQIASSQYIEGLRSSTQSLPIAADFPLLLHIDVGPEPSGKIFTVRMLNSQSEDPVYEEQGLVSGSEGYLSLLLREEMTGDYEILVYAGSDLTSNYRITIR